MPTGKWRLAPEWLPAFCSKSRVLFTSEQETLVFEGEEARVVSAALDEANECSAADPLLDKLRSRQVFIRSDGIGNRPREEAFRRASGVDPTGVPLALACLALPGRALLSQTLETSGFHLDEDASRLIVLTDDYLRPEVEAIARAEARPWLLAKCVGHHILVGPAFSHGCTPCWYCLAHWLKTRRWAQAAHYGWDRSNCPPQPSFSAYAGSLAIGAGLIAHAAAEWATSEQDSRFRGTVRLFDTGTMDCAAWDVSPGPRCACTAGPRAFSIGRRELTYWANPVTGIVTEIRIASQPFAGLFHASAVHLQPLPVPGARALLKPGLAFGHGFSPGDAEASAIAEAIERHSLVYQGDEPEIVSKLGELPGAVDPTSILLYSPAQYARREQNNRERADLFQVPEPFDPDAAVPWVRGTSLVSGEARYVPSALTCMWRTTANGGLFAYADTNGCAAAPTPEEAQLRALLELIERDAVAIWWYNRVRRPGVDYASLDGSRIAEIAAACEAMGRKVALLDLTTDIGIPVYVAVAPLEDGSQPFFGCAAHPDPAVAARKAIGELVQTWFWSVHGRPARELREWIEKGRSVEGGFLQPVGQIAGVRPFATPSLRRCVDVVAAADMDVIAVDLTRPEIGLPVWRVFVPGLRHVWRRLAPGRLYEVPVRLGWLDQPVGEFDVNSADCPL